MPHTTRYEELLPRDLERIMEQRPVVYLPFGTLEWHCYHLALGLDAVKAHELLMRVAARAGGVTVPATYWAIGGMPHPWTSRVDEDLIERLFLAIYEQMAHVGFKTMIALTGHYGIEQYLCLKRAAVHFMERSGCTVFAGPEFELVTDLGYRGDHAGKWETSILWSLRPELVDMSQLDSDTSVPLEGVGGEDPRVHASQELGNRIVEAMVERYAAVAERLSRISPLDRSRHINVLRMQVRVLEMQVEQRKRLPRENQIQIWTQTAYAQFHDAFRQGDYPAAQQAITSVLADFQNAAAHS